MSGKLFDYYQTELDKLRDYGERFAEEYPKVAGRLQLSRTAAADPHVERLIESVALISARLQLKIDDDFSRVSEALLEHIHPHLARPVPSCTIVRFEPDAASMSGEMEVPKGAMLSSVALRSSVEMAGLSCQFLTVYPTQLLPVAIDAVSFAPVRGASLVSGDEVVDGVLSISLSRPGAAALGDLDVTRLRLFVDGEADTANMLYEMLMSASVGVFVRTEGPDGPQTRRLRDAGFEPVGFAAEDALLQYDARSHAGYRMLQEFLVFPEKFRFVDLVVPGGLFLDEGATAEILITTAPFPRQEWASRLYGRIGTRNLQLGCTPAVNLFPVSAQPIRIEPGRERYPVLPDTRRARGMEIQAIREVMVVRRGGTVRRQRLVPLFGVPDPHAVADHGGAPADALPRWTYEREPAVAGEGDQHFLWLIDPDLAVLSHGDAVASVEAYCSNGDLPAMLPFGNPAGDFSYGENVPVLAITCVTRPTQTVRRARNDGEFWRLVSNLTLNYTSLVDAGGLGLRQILQAHNLFDPGVMPGEHAEASRMIDGITGVSVERAVERMGSAARRAFVQGARIRLTLDEAAFPGSAYLFAAVMERFLSVLAGGNSFTQLVAKSTQREKEIGAWPCRAGDFPIV